MEATSTRTEIDLSIAAQDINASMQDVIAHAQYIIDTLRGTGAVQATPVAINAREAALHLADIIDAHLPDMTESDRQHQADFEAECAWEESLGR